MSTEWTRRWGYMVAPSPSRPGIYRMEVGGYLVRARITDPKSGKLRTVIKALRDTSVEEAQRTLDELRADKRAEVGGRMPSKQLFATFAVSRFRAKLIEKRIKSAKGRAKWEQVLRVQIIPTFGAYRCDEIRVWDLVQWREKIATWMRDGYEYERALKNGKTDRRKTDLSPRTANTWLSIMRVLCSEMAELLELPLRATRALEYFDTSQSPTYTDEAPNALTPEWARKFVDEMRRQFPQFYAMTLLGFATGKRPSTLRPLRRSGPECDVEWDDGFVRFRRSHTRGAETMVGTKTGTSERVYLPEGVMQALREQVAGVEIAKGPRGEKMRASDLLFPSIRGGMRSPSCLDKPFAAVAKAIGLPFELTPRAMRRTFNDLARAAQVHDVVARSITGHATEAMQIHYSTARADEQREAIAKVIALVGTG